MAAGCSQREGLEGMLDCELADLDVGYYLPWTLGYLGYAPVACTPQVGCSQALLEHGCAREDGFEHELECVEGGAVGPNTAGSDLYHNSKGGLSLTRHRFHKVYISICFTDHV